MASVPGRGDSVSTVRNFYVDHAGVVVAAQVLGLVAAAAFVPFVLGLASAAVRRRPVVAGGLEVAAPLGFLVFVLVLAVPLLRGWQVVSGPPAGQAGDRGSRSSVD